MPKFLQLFLTFFTKVQPAIVSRVLTIEKKFTIILLNIIKKHLHNPEEVITSVFQTFIDFMKKINIYEHEFLQ